MLIASLSLRVIGVFDSRDLVPVVGGREDGGEGISTPLECEFRLRLRILILQFHPPLLRDSEIPPYSVRK